MKTQLREKATSALGIAVLLLHLEQAIAVEFEPQGKALASVLGSTKVSAKTLGDTKFFYTKDANGKPARVAVIETGIYEPNCTHTWAIGLNGSTGAVTDVRVIEMSCPHAFPARAASYLEQYKGKGPKDVAKLDSKIQTIAKATGSCRLTTDAVTRAITRYSKVKGQL